MKAIVALAVLLSLLATTIQATADPGGGPGGPQKETAPKEPKGGK